MTKKPAKTKAKPAADGEKKLGADLLMPPSSTVRSLQIDRRKALKTSRNATSGFGGLMADAVKKKHLDKKAAGIAFGLDDLPDEKLAITLPHLLRYIDDLGLIERASKQAEMFEEPKTDKTGGNPNGRSDAEGTRSTGGVHHIGPAVRKVAEQAGAGLSDG